MVKRDIFSIRQEVLKVPDVFPTVKTVQKAFSSARPHPNYQIAADSDEKIHV